MAPHTCSLNAHWQRSCPTGYTSNSPWRSVSVLRKPALEALDTTSNWP